MSESGTGDGPVWYLWTDAVPRPGAVNMAIDQALLYRAGRAGERWLRLYSWDPSCLSLGRHETATRRYDRGRIAAAGIDVVRRPTGGRAVWHARELTYAVAAPDGSMGGLRDAYLEIHGMLQRALDRTGAMTSLAGAATVPGLDSGACFATAVGGEVLVAGRKIVGSAQLREAGGLLQHGSILLDDDQSTVRAMTRGAPPPDGSAALSAMLGRAVPTAEMAEAVAAAARDTWSGSWRLLSEAPSVLAESGAHLPRYRSAEWTWRA